MLNLGLREGHADGRGGREIWVAQCHLGCVGQDGPGLEFHQLTSRRQCKVKYRKYGSY